MKLQSDNRVLVTGGAGYVGSILTRKLLERGWEVTVFDALVYGDESIRELKGHPGYRLIQDDMRNVEAVASALENVDAVVHLGALVGDPASELDEKLTLDINVAATLAIAKMALSLGASRFIFASTCSVYGASDQLLDESSDLNPVSLYARSKIESEQSLLALNNESPSTIILRFGTMFGLSLRPRFDLVVNLLTAQAVLDNTFTIFGGNQWRPFIHVQDAAEAILNCLEAPCESVSSQVFNVGSEELNYSIAQVGDLIKEVIPDVQMVRKTESRDQRNYRVSFAKMRQHMGFTPQYTVVDGIQEIKAAIEANVISDYRDARYSNYKTLSEGGKVDLLSRALTNCSDAEDIG